MTSKNRNLMMAVGKEGIGEGLGSGSGLVVPTGVSERVEMSAPPAGTQISSSHDAGTRSAVVQGPQIPVPGRSAVTHSVVDREAGFEAMVTMVDGKVDGKVVGRWRKITVSARQRKFGGFTPRGAWKPCD